MKVSPKRRRQIAAALVGVVVEGLVLALMDRYAKRTR